MWTMELLNELSVIIQRYTAHNISTDISQVEDICILLGNLDLLHLQQLEAEERVILENAMNLCSGVLR